MGRLDDRPVAGDVRHRAQRVEFLGAGETGHAIHRQHGGLFRGQPLQQLRILRGPEEADQAAALAQQVSLVDPELRLALRRPHFQDDVGPGPERPRIGDDFGADLAEGFVREISLVARPRLDGDREAKPQQPLRHPRGHCDALLARVHFPGNPNLHAHPPRIPILVNLISLYMNRQAAQKGLDARRATQWMLRRTPVRRRQPQGAQRRRRAIFSGRLNGGRGARR